MLIKPSVLVLMAAFLVGLTSSGVANGQQPAEEGRAASIEELRQRLTSKVERVKAGAQQWMASGRNPMDLLKVMQEEFQPLMQAGKPVEAEAVLDRVLDQLGVPADEKPAAPSGVGNAEERVLARVHAIQNALPAWIEKHGKSAACDALLQSLRQQLAEMNFAEAEKTADEVLSLMGIPVPAAGPSRHAAQRDGGSPQQDPFSNLIRPQFVCLASDAIELTDQQRDTLLTLLQEGEPRLKELSTLVERENAVLAELLAQTPLDEEVILAQLTVILDHEREAKQISAHLGIATQNTLTSDQLTKLRELQREPDVLPKLEEQFKNRITSKVQSVMEGAQRWAQNGRDPAAVAQAMETKVRPLMDEGRVFEADAALDQVLILLSEAVK
jgi:hypothetical protein